MINKCKQHSCAPHGFDRVASHSEDTYVCECEYWEPARGCKGIALSNQADTLANALYEVRKYRRGEGVYDASIVSVAEREVYMIECWQEVELMSDKALACYEKELK